MRRAIQREQPAALKDAIDDRLREVLIMEHATPLGDGLVRREEHRALPAMALIDDVEEHVGGVRAVGEVADFIDDQHVGVRVRGERGREPTVAEAVGEIVDQFRRGDRPR